jgi:hypothetical protein
LVGIGLYYTPAAGKKQVFSHGDFVTEKAGKRGYTVVTKEKQGGQPYVCYEYQSE